MVSVEAMQQIAPACIHVLLFAELREQAGWSEIQWPIARSNAIVPTPALVWEALELPGTLDVLRVAINHQFADPSTPLKPGDEVAFLPPISGG